ncbi:hypothetical protein yc1106_09147 [Curvularia clavata]|uniref:Carbohydrate-binding module family 18 protein n=1 Tax=Curvularia clavata TaxID=95742 RepID=A0A9Q8ZKT9_CURCL|nr:hypothetical protein yc1106_09147 [Curvularia clavata]
MRFISSCSGYMAILWLFTTANAAAGDIVCRYTATTPSTVNSYMCQYLAYYYWISLEKLFELNPSLDLSCNTIKPKTEYCVAGFLDYPVSTDGFCGPKHNNATCIGTEKPCCNAATWKCGNSPEDCAPDTCYEGLCAGPTSFYSLDGKCGPSTGDKECTGKWGDCCNYDGLCGTGPDFCSVENCHNGAYVPPPRQEPVATWTFGTTPDGTCGGPNGYTCGVIHGNCCSKDNKCGGTIVECGTGCQPEYGECDAPDVTPPSETDLSRLVWDPKTYIKTVHVEDPNGRHAWRVVLDIAARSMASVETQPPTVVEDVNSIIRAGV